MRLRKLDGSAARPPPSAFQSAMVARNPSVSEGSGVSRLHLAAAFDFLVQKVCIEPNGRVVRVDPYACPASDHLRPLGVGEALPYHRYDQPVADRPEGRQRRDSFPVRTPSGQTVVVSTFDHSPFGAFKSQRDGYSLAVVREGWASSGGTRSRLLGTTFFGAGCKPYNGWVYFPTAALNGGSITPGQVRMPIAGVHWEQTGQAWPGACPAQYHSEALTTWEPVAGFAFGGPAGPAKRIDAIRSVHGFVQSPTFMARGHVEVFYFTRLYGFTRWEAWVPRSQLDGNPQEQREYQTAAERCSGSGDITYQGLPFARTDCRDWTDVELPAAPEAAPSWDVPIP